LPHQCQKLDGVSTPPKAVATNRLKVITYAHVMTVVVDERAGRVTGMPLARDVMGP
jgi:hypothetical protein